MNVVMIGSGYVGLVSGACFAEFGANVVCLDVDEGKIERLNAGEIPIYEPGLEALVASNVKQGRLSFSTDFEHVRAADCVFIAVGTPTRRGDGHADLSYVYAAAKQVAEYLEGYTVIVDKSTVPVGSPAGQTNRRRDQSKRRFRRRLEPRVFARRCGDQRFHASRPSRFGRGVRPRGRYTSVALQTFKPHRNADHGR